MTSYGYDDPNPKNYSSSIAISRPKRRQSSFQFLNRPGILLKRINDDCNVTESSLFRIGNGESDKLRDYLQNLPNNTRIAGITYDDFTLGLKKDAKDALINVGLDLSTASYRSSLCFLFTTGKAKQTKQNQARRGEGPSRLSFVNVFD